MKDNVKLFIANKLVDCEETLGLPITYQTEDFSNPTIVKNSFSKTISIKGTKNNNKLFGEIYKLDRMQHYEEWTGWSELNGMNFDPSKRVDFSIYNNGDLVETGYMQLNDISIQNGDITYNITLYGGLGDFFYGLKYNEDGTERTLADLRYFIKDEYGNYLPENTEFNFRINKDLVNQSFSKDWTVDGDQLLDYLAFIPAYNGTYEDFDTSHCIINTNNDIIFPKEQTEIEDNVEVTYSTIDGFSLANLEKDYTEWEMKDLRSYYQRPAIRLKKLIETICKEENSGYQVDLDPTFFNKNNPYWEKTFVALPLLTSNDYDTEVEEATSVSILNESTNWAGDKGIIQKPSASSNVLVSGISESVSSAGIITFPESSITSTMDLSFDFQVFAQTLDSNVYDMLQMYNATGSNLTNSNQFITVYLTAEDADTNTVLGYSNGYQLQDHRFIYNNAPYIANSNVPATSIVFGRFYKDGSRYYFKADNEDNTFSIRLTECPIAHRVKLVLHTEIKIVQQSGTRRYILSHIINPNSSEDYRYWVNVVTTNGKFSISIDDGVSSNRTITKRNLLKTESSPADYLLDYAKLFGLYFIKDVFEKKITILTRNSFFTGETVNIDKLIDYDKDMTVTPILFDKKYYTLALDTPATRFAERYNSEYSQTYGQKRIYTGYNFTSDNTNFYEDNLYQGIIPALDSDKYYRTYFNTNNAEVPCFVCDNVSCDLYNGDKTISIDLYGANIVDRRRTIDWSVIAGADIFPKSCFFTLDNGDRSLEEISSCLLMWNGLKDCKDYTGRDVYFNITDDLGIMNTLNDKEPCFIYTVSEYDVSGNRIAYRRNTLPQYLNLIIDDYKNVSESLDFGMPKEVYCGNINYSPEKTIYDRFWKMFYNDQFNIDTKKVTCYVKFDRMNQDYLRKFYWFNNAIWILNKVDSYDVNDFGTTRCEFIKVQDTNNYVNGQISY